MISELTRWMSQSDKPLRLKLVTCVTTALLPMPRRRQRRQKNTSAEGAAFEVFTDAHVHDEVTDTCKSVIRKHHQKPHKTTFATEELSIVVRIETLLRRETHIQRPNHEEA